MLCIFKVIGFQAQLNERATKIVTKYSDLENTACRTTTTNTAQHNANDFFPFRFMLQWRNFTKQLNIEISFQSFLFVGEIILHMKQNWNWILYATHSVVQHTRCAILTTSITFQSQCVCCRYHMEVNCLTWNAHCAHTHTSEWVFRSKKVRSDGRLTSFLCN